MVEEASEEAAVLRWRIDRFVELGVAQVDALELAVSPVDLHEFAHLVEHGCDPKLAANVLA